MNKFESSNPETSNEGHEDLIKYYEDLEAEERAKEKVEFGPHVEEFEELLAPLLKEEVLDVLSVIETEEEALKSKEREFTKEALVRIVDKLKYLDRRTNINEEELGGLRRKYKIISNAVGFINNGKVDHDR